MLERAPETAPEIEPLVVLELCNEVPVGVRPHEVFTPFVTPRLEEHGRTKLDDSYLVD